MSDLLSHKYWSAMYGVKIISMRESPKKLWNKLYAVFKPYNARFRTTISPKFAPNYWPHVEQTFSVHGAVKNEFPMSPAISPSPFFV